jgi:hypothetical protein
MNPQNPSTARENPIDRQYYPYLQIQALYVIAQYSARITLAPPRNPLQGVLVEKRPLV